MSVAQAIGFRLMNCGTCKIGPFLLEAKQLHELDIGLRKFQNDAGIADLEIAAKF